MVNGKWYSVQTGENKVKILMEKPKENTQELLIKQLIAFIAAHIDEKSMIDEDGNYNLIRMKNNYIKVQTSTKSYYFYLQINETSGMICYVPVKEGEWGRVETLFS